MCKRHGKKANIVPKGVKEGHVFCSVVIVFFFYFFLLYFILFYLILSFFLFNEKAVASLYLFVVKQKVVQVLIWRSKIMGNFGGCDDLHVINQTIKQSK